ncbi:MAG: mannitol dehydrogenase [Clostridiales bacterium]|jgi:mannitol-1-phosphate 5-dehydrogenase|nr:mannitol dehydrogenase [Clostridiales bacterium]
MLNAVMYGAGNIGRGFIGAQLSQSGYRVTFIDVAPELIRRLNAEGRYPLRLVTDGDYEDIEITNVDAVSGNDTDAAADCIASADIVATAVGANALKYITPNITEGLRRRFQRTDAPLNILLCENMPEVDIIMRNYIKELMTEEERAMFDLRVGLVETSIGRMVPMQTPEMSADNPLRVCVERYGFLPVDKDAFKGDIPCIQKMIPYSPFGFYLKRKLFIHNMGHAVCAYLGLYIGDTYIYEAVNNADIIIIAKNAMLESMEALCREYGVPITDVLHHIDDLLLRFTNRALGDTCERVGRDTERKLKPSDRLIGAAKLCVSNGVSPVHISIAAAAAVYRHLLENAQRQTAENAQALLSEISEAPDEIIAIIMRFYEQLRNGTTPARLRKIALDLRKEALTDVV